MFGFLFFFLLIHNRYNATTSFSEITSFFCVLWSGKNLDHKDNQNIVFLVFTAFSSC